MQLVEIAKAGRQLVDSGMEEVFELAVGPGRENWRTDGQAILRSGRIPILTRPRALCDAVRKIHAAVTRLVVPAFHSAIRVSWRSSERSSFRKPYWLATRVIRRGR